MNNVFISSAKKNEVVENFVRSKREELEKMIPGFVDDRKFTDIVLNFYKRGIRDGAQMMLDTLEMKEVDDKAIEKIKYVMEHGVQPVLNKEDLQDIFPELKESEDERIGYATDALCIKFAQKKKGYLIT